MEVFRKDRNAIDFKSNIRETKINSKKLELQALVSIAVVSMSMAAVVPTDGAVDDQTMPEAPSRGFPRSDDNVELDQTFVWNFRENHGTEFHLACREGRGERPLAERSC